MKKYRPESWSQQAREKANKAFANWMAALSEPEELRTVTYYTAHEIIEREMSTHNPNYHFFYCIQNSYRHPLIKNRAAKRYGRLVREYQRKHK